MIYIVGDVVYVIDGKTNSVVANITVGQTLVGIAVNPLPTWFMYLIMLLAQFLL